MGFQVIYGDIFKYKADAFVMPANPKPLVGSGLDQYVYKMAGRTRLLSAREQEIGELEYGDVGITTAYDFDAKYIIHAASPRWIDGESGEIDCLRNCYSKSIEMAIKHNCTSILFPLLSSGMQRFPYDIAIEIAKEECEKFADGIDIKIVIYSKRLQDAKDYRNGVGAYIWEHTYDNVDEEKFEEYKVLWGSLPPEREERQNLEIMRKQLANKQYEEDRIRRFERRQQAKERKKNNSQNQVSYSYMMMDVTTLSLDLTPEPSFAQVLDRFIKEKGLVNRRTLCSKANLTEDRLSKAISGTRPATRDILWALTIGLKLTLEEAEELFSSCDKCIYTRYRISDDDQRREKVIRYCIEKKFKDIDEVNYLLLDYKMKTLGNYDKAS